MWATQKSLGPKVYFGSVATVEGWPPTSGPPRTSDIVGIARASGLGQSAWAADEDAFAELARRALTEDGPWLIGCRIDSGKPVDTTERDPGRIRDQFMRGLGMR